MNVEMEQLLLTDAQGRAVEVNLWQSLTAERVWHFEFQFEHEGEWLYLDLIPLDEIDDDGFMLDEDGGFSLSHCEIVDDEPVYGEVMTLPPAAVGRLLEWAHEQLRIKPQKRLRPSALAERALIATA